MNIFTLSVPEKIRIEHHPSSGLAAEELLLDDYLQKQYTKKSPDNDYQGSTETSRPAWHPSKSFADFTFAEYVITNSLSQPQVDKLLHQQRSVSTNSPENSQISFKNYHEMVPYLNESNQAA